MYKTWTIEVVSGLETEYIVKTRTLFGHRNEDTVELLILNPRF